MKNNIPSFDKNRKIKIGGIEILGNVKTKNYLFEHFMKGLEKNENMDDLVNHLNKIRNALMGLNLFTDIHFHVEPAQYLDNDFVELVTIVKEAKYNKTMINTSIGNQGQTIVSFLFFYDH